MTIFQNKKLFHKYLHAKAVSHHLLSKRSHYTVKKKNWFECKIECLHFSSYIAIEHRGEKVSGPFFAEENQIFFKNN